MKNRFVLPLLLVALALWLAAGAAAKAKTGNDKDNKDANSATAPATHSAQDDTMRLEGEKRFHANCGRCHAAPPKFPPRMVATIVRHMRVRATLTDEDMRYIIHYMSE